MNKGRVKSCTSCRQVKLRCNAQSVYPAACSRCKARNLECGFDPSFKRLPVRGRLEEATKRLNQLQTALARQSSASLPEIPSSPVTCFKTPEEEESWKSLDYFGLQDQDGARSLFEPKQLGDVVLARETITDLFLHFYRFRHRHLPIVDTNVSTEEIYLSSPLLFWTIAVISCQYNPCHPDLYQLLVDPYENLLCSTLLKQISSLKTIQAILLLCTWPFPVRHQHDEPSLNYCGLAISAALQMGLHRLGHPSEYKNSKTSSSYIESAMTWMACFQVSTYLSSNIGLPPTLGSDMHLEGIRLICCNASIPKKFAAQTEIQRHVARYISALDGSHEPHSRTSLVQIFDRELDAIRQPFQEAWTYQIEFSLLAGRLYLYALYFTAQPGQPQNTVEVASSSTVGISSRIILHLGLATAVRLIETFLAECVSPSTSPMSATHISHSQVEGNGECDNQCGRFHPKRYFQALFFAGCFLFYFLSSESEATDHDKSRAISHIDSIHEIFTQHQGSEEHERAARKLEMLRNLINQKSKHPAITVNTRLGANLYYNTLQAVREFKHHIRQRDRAQATGISQVNRQTDETGAANLIDPPLEQTLPPGWEFFPSDTWDASWLEETINPGAFTS